MAELLVQEINLLRYAIRKHRDQRGDDRCWKDDEDLYRVLPEGYTAPARDTAVELEQCKKFIACRQNPATEYVSPQREIERLQEIERKCIDAADEYCSTQTTTLARLNAVARAHGWGESSDDPTTTGLNNEIELLHREIVQLRAALDKAALEHRG